MSAKRPRTTDADRNGRARSLERAAWIILLAVIALRPMLAETHSSAQSGIASVLTQAGSSGPGVTVVLDAALLVAMILIAVAGLLAKRAYRRIGFERALLLLCCVAVLSTVVASNKRLALNAATDWALTLMIAPALFQLFRGVRSARIAVCVILATAGTFAFQCVIQETVEFEETISQYEETREQLWDSQGIALDSPRVTLFERRLYAREASGFAAHSNVAGGYLAMCALLGVGLTWSKLYGRVMPMRRGFAIVAAAVTALIALPIAWTGSKGAVAAGAGAGLMALTLWLVPALRRNPRNTWRLGWVVAVMVLVAVVGHGMTHGGLPGASMNFRWQYWTHASEMVRDHPVLGVGMSNFGRHYPRYKPITSPEEISDPHNMLVRAAAEWGWLGVGALVWLLVAGSRAIAVPNGESQDPQRSPRDEKTESMHPWQTGIIIAALLALGKGAAQGYVSFPYWFVSALTPALMWMLLYAVLILDTNRLDSPADDPPEGLALWAGAAAVAFMLVNLISFSWFSSGSGTTFAALVAVAVFLRRVPPRAADAKRPEQSRAARTIGLVLLVGCFFFFLVSVLIPTLRSGLSLSAARRDISAGNSQAAIRAYERAIRQDPLDPVPPLEAARKLAATSGAGSGPALAALNRALEWCDLAKRRDPADTMPLLLQARILERRFAQTGDPKDAQRAVDATRTALEGNPSSPDLYVLLGDRLMSLAETIGSADRLDQAADAYRRALELDDARPVEEIRRFNDTRRSYVRARIESCVSRVPVSEQ